MKTRWTHLLTFLIGVTLTVGVYESRRMLRNTTRALSVASGQMGGESQSNAKRQALLQALEKERGTEALSALKDRRDDRKGARPQAGRAGGEAKARTTRTRTVRTLTPQQVRDIKERRRARRQAIEEGGEAPRVVRSDARSGSDPSPSIEAPADGEAPVEVLDTAIPLPAE